MYDDDYYDDDYDGSSLLDSALDEANLKEFIQTLFQGLKKIYNDNGNTLEYLINEYEGMAQHINFSESYIISTIIEEAQELEPLKLRERVTSNSIYLPFYKLKKNNDIIGYIEVFSDKNIQYVANKLVEFGAYKKLAYILMEFFLEIEKKENEKRENDKIEEKRKLEYEQQNKSNNEFTYRNEDAETNEEILYWMAVGDGDIDPSEDPPWVNRNTYDYYDDYYEKSDFEIYRDRLKKLEGTDHYIHLIKDAKDIEITEKIIMLQSITRIIESIPIFNYTSSHVLSAVEAMNRADNYIEILQDLMQTHNLDAQIAGENITLVRKSDGLTLSKFSYYKPLNQFSENGWSHLHSIYVFRIKRLSNNNVEFNELSVDISKKVLKLLGGYELPEKVWGDLKLYMEGNKEYYQQKYHNNFETVFHTHEDYDNPGFEKAEIRFSKKD